MATNKNMNYIKTEEAMILAAGLGKRMRYKTRYKAKPLIELQNKSLLDLNLRKLSNYGIKKCVINTNYLHLTIKQFIHNYNFKNRYPHIIISHEQKKLETGGGVKNAISNFNRDKFLVINGDSLIINNKNDCPIKKLYDNYKDNMDALLLLVSKKNSIGYLGNGDFTSLKKSKIFKLKRKNLCSKYNFVFTGWQLFRKDVFKEFNNKCFSLNLLYDRAINRNRLYGIFYSGKFLHIGDPKSFLMVKNYLALNNLRVI